MIDLHDLRARISGAWAADTSASPDAWTPERPSIGQCAVTALTVQDAIGGHLLRCVNEGVSHYYNGVSGLGIDFTRDQFDTWTPSEVEIRGRDYVLSFPATQERYDRLRARLSDGALHALRTRLRGDFL